jgi:hypothetical protein
MESGSRCAHGLDLAPRGSGSQTVIGIEVVAGVTSGGRNHASGNGRAAQWLNITCSP